MKDMHIDTAPIVAEIERLQAMLEAAEVFNASLNGSGRTRGQRAAATRAANKQAEYERRSKAMKKAWKTRKAAAEG
jgi:hypothetical protein